jgi:dihydrolipoamide dehydrogenase
MTRPPSSLLVWGEAGFIEVEMATLLTTFGSKVFLATQHQRILPREDGETSQRLAQALREQGVEILTRAALDSVGKSNGGFEARFSGSEERTVEVEKVLISSRKPNTSDMGIEALGLRFKEDGGIWVSDRLETSAKGVYAVGDATGGWMNSHAASAMAVTAAENAMGQSNDFPFHLIPRGIWTFPQIGAVGLSEEDAERQGFDVEVGDFPYSINGLAMCHGEVDGAVKIISDSAFGDVLGVHIVGANATELVGEAVMALQLECTADTLAHTIRVHPTFSEALMDAGRDASNWALYLPKS